MMNFAEINPSGFVPILLEGFGYDDRDGGGNRILLIGIGEIGDQVMSELSALGVGQPSPQYPEAFVDKKGLESSLIHNLQRDLIAGYCGVFVVGNWQPESPVGSWVKDLCLEARRSHLFAIAFVRQDAANVEVSDVSCFDAFLIHRQSFGVELFTGFYEFCTCISNLLDPDKLMNVCLSDIRSILTCSGELAMGIGLASGKRRIDRAIAGAIGHLNSQGIDEAERSGAIISITGPKDLSKEEILQSGLLFHKVLLQSTRGTVGVISRENDAYVKVTMIVSGKNSI